MTITEITPQKHRPNRYSVFLDQEFAFGMSGEDILFYHLTPGLEISEERLETLKDQVIFVKAQEKAMRYIGAQPRTYRETVTKLAEDYPEDVIERVMTLLVKYHYIDDAQYAMEFTRSRMRYGRYGLFRIRQTLKQKGIADELIDQAASDAGEDYSEISAARDWLRSKRIDPDEMDYTQRRRCTAALARRGFSYGIIKAVLSGEDCDE